jgi:6-phosphogluconolactonase
MWIPINIAFPPRVAIGYGFIASCVIYAEPGSFDPRLFVAVAEESMFEGDWRKFDDREVMAQRVASYVAPLIRSAIAARGGATLALAGGQTPIPAFRELAEARLDWSNVTLLPTDDRLVAADDPLSNIGLIRRCFGATDATTLALTDVSDGDPIKAAEDANARLALLDWPLDLVWLGIGEDGHTASILPGPDFDKALTASQRACGVVPDPLPKDAPVARVTLTRAALLSTHVLLVMFTGARKQAIIERAIADGPQATTAIGRILADTPMPVVLFSSP